MSSTPPSRPPDLIVLGICEKVETFSVLGARDANQLRGRAGSDQFQRYSTVQGKDSRIDTDADGQGEDCNGGEAGRPGQDAQCVTQIHGPLRALRGPPVEQAVSPVTG